MTDRNLNATPLDVTAGRRTIRGTWQSARDPAHHTAHLRTAGELWARVQAAEKEEQAARERYEAFGVLDPTSEGSLEYEEADDASRAAWVRAEEARHDLDAFLNPKRYARKGYRAEALDEFRAQPETELEMEAGL
jgi:hypothetical protein